MMAKEQVFDIKDLSFWKCQDVDCLISAHKEVFKMARDSSSSDIAEAFGEIYTVPNSEETLDLASALATEQMPAFQTTDGMSYLAVPDNGMVMLYADLNGKSEPNTFGEDMFCFSISGNGVFNDMTSMIIPEPPPEPPKELQACINNPDNCTTSEQCYASNDWLGERGSYGQGCRTWYYSYDFSTGTGTYSCVNMYCR